MANPLVFSLAPVEAILRVAAQFPVFPCRRSAEELVIDGKTILRKAKSPLVTNGFQKATRDADQIRAWWNRWPDALVGVPTGSETRLAVLDSP